MPRPTLTDDQLNDMRARLMAETGRLIAREGYAAFSMRRLATMVNLTAGALYRYFPTKHHVLLAYFAEALETLTSRITAISAAEADHRVAVRRVMEDYVRFCLEDRDRFRLLFLENDQGQLPELSDDAAVAKPFLVVRERVYQAIASGDLRAVPADQATQILWGAVHGVICLSITVVEMDFGDVRTLASAALENAIRGLTPSALEN
jgi:AcrR family transcriptional regulator